MTVIQIKIVVFAKESIFGGSQYIPGFQTYETITSYINRDLKAKITILNGPTQNHRMAIPALPCGIFCDAWEGFIFYFFNIQREIVRSGA